MINENYYTSIESPKIVIKFANALFITSVLKWHQIEK